ncbi:MAG: DUF1080 domain-containing protein [Lentisphaeraceae bacterium]|nr:DUF1080 domain-containing protein [Lentisphaeraceae bacterium]
MFRTLATAVLGIALTNSCTQLSQPSVKCSLTEEKVLFDGQNLDKFDHIGSDFWTLPGDGTVKGESTPEKKLKRNTFLISKDKDIADFEATLWYKLTTSNNSGVIYRAEQIDDPALFRVKGYQAEGENDMLKGGFMYDEARRAWIANPGEFVIVKSKKDKKIVGQVNDHEKLIEKKFLNDKEWNFYRIVARGNHFMHYINGELAIELIDVDPVDASRTGSFCLQIHAGKPMTVFFKDVVVDKYKKLFGKTQVLFMGSLKGWNSANAKTETKPYNSPMERGLVVRGYDPKKKLEATSVAIDKGFISRKLPANQGLVRFHVKGNASIQLGDQTFVLPAVETNIDGYNQVELLMKNGKVDFSVNNKTISTNAFAGQELKVSAANASVRNAIFLPFQK